MSETKLCPTVGSPWKKSWFRLWRSPGRTHEEVVGISTEDQAGVARRRAGSAREDDRRSGTCALFLDKHLKDELPGKESRAKSAGIILRIWSGIPPERVALLRDRAVALLPRISGQERIWLHWGMSALAYPFFRDTAEVVGRLLALQDDFTTAQVQGATGTPSRKPRSDSSRPWWIGKCLALRRRRATSYWPQGQQQASSICNSGCWRHRRRALPTKSRPSSCCACRSRSRSPSPSVADLRRYEGFNIHRQGLDMDMVALPRARSKTPPKMPLSRTTDTSTKAALFEMDPAGPVKRKD